MVFFTFREDRTDWRELSVCLWLSEWLALFLGWMVSAAGEEHTTSPPALSIKGGGGTFRKIPVVSTLTRTMLFPFTPPAWGGGVRICQRNRCKPQQNVYLSLKKKVKTHFSLINYTDCCLTDQILAYKWIWKSEITIKSFISLHSLKVYSYHKQVFFFEDM